MLKKHNVYLLFITLYFFILDTSQAQSLIISEVMAANENIIEDESGEFDDWIELYNNSSSPIDLKNFYLSDEGSNPNKFEFQSSLIIEPFQYLLLWADDQPEQGNNHLNFKLSKGESLFIHDNNGLIDEFKIDFLHINVSSGREPSISNEIVCYLIPTPNSKNNSSLKYLSSVSISEDSGNYDEAFNITLSSDEGSEIYYTTDGTTPSSNSIKYQNNPILISADKTIRAISLRVGYLPSAVKTNTYIFNQTSSIPSLFVTSKDAINGSKNVSVHAELVDEFGEILFSENASSRLHGDLGQLSFKLFFGPKHGGCKVTKPIFEYKNDVSAFKSLIFRQAGNDGINTKNNGKAHLRDGFISTIVNRGKFNFKASGFRQVSVFLNGNYHGIFNMRERIDKSFIENNYNIKDNVPKCFIEYKFKVPGNVNEIEGDFSYFKDNLWTLCLDKNLSDDQKFNDATNFIDLNSFTDYWIHEVFIGNFDWLSNNMYFWSTTAPAGKFRWILWDTDIGMGYKYQNYGKPSWNTLKWATSTESGRPWNGKRTAIIRGLLTNEAYKYFFINRFCDLLNTEYLPSSTLNILNNLSDKIELEIPKHISKWGVGSLQAWENELEIIKNYVTVRPNYIRAHIKAKFLLEEMNQVGINTSIAGAGIFYLNTIELLTPMLPWQGKYFKDIPIKLTAIPKEGYQFVGWEHTNDISNTIEIIPTSDLIITAVFEEIASSNYNVVINEISSSQIETKESADWVELYNPTEQSIDLSGWRFEDSSDKDSYILPEGATIEPHGFVLLTQNEVQFLNIYSDVGVIYGNFDFGLKKKGELLQLFDKNGGLVDVVNYNKNETWPENNNVQSIALIDPTLNNNEGSSWKQSNPINGTPGSDNHMSPTNEVNKSLLVFPNPTSNFVEIVMPIPGWLYIYNSIGKFIDSESIYKSNTFISLSSYPPGMYYLKFITNIGDIYSTTIIKSP